MNKKVVLTIVFTLIAGFAIGMFTAGRLAQKRMDKVREFMDDPSKEKSRIQRKLGLEDISEADVILDNYLRDLKTIRRESRAKTDSLRQILYQNLEPHLSTEDLNRIKERFKRKKRRPKNGRGKRKKGRSME